MKGCKICSVIPFSRDKCMWSSSERIKFIGDKIEKKNQLKMYSKARFSTGKFKYFEFSIRDNLSAVLDSI